LWACPHPARTWAQKQRNTRCSNPLPGIACGGTEHCVLQYSEWFVECADSWNCYSYLQLSPVNPVIGSNSIPTQ
jgi:hypothetical protein